MAHSVTTMSILSIARWLPHWEDIPPAPGQGPGPEGVKPIFRMLLSAFPDLSHPDFAGSSAVQVLNG
jgi:hypothetical protein